MDFVKRIVKGYVFDGNVPVTNAKIKFQLSELIGFTSTHVNIDRPIIAVTDQDGYFEKGLWCDETSLVALNWNAYYPNENNGEPQEQYLKQFSLVYGDGEPIWIGVLQALGLPAPDDTTLLYAAVYAYILTLIADGTIPSVTASRTVNGTTVTIGVADKGNVIVLTSNSPITLNLPAGLGADFPFGIVHRGTGLVTPAPGVGVTLFNSDAPTHTKLKQGKSSFYSIANNDFEFGGATE